MEVEVEGSSMFDKEEAVLEWSSWSPCSGPCRRSRQSRWSRCLDTGRLDMMDCIEVRVR